MPNTTVRRQTWYHKRRVRKRYASVVRRPVLWESLAESRKHRR